jgi:hypothetical protein
MLDSVNRGDGAWMGPTTGWPKVNAHVVRTVDIEVADCPGVLSLRVVLRHEDYPALSRAELRDAGIRLGEALAPALRAALRAEGIEAR